MAAGESRSIVGAEESASFRTNLGVLEIAGAPVTVRLRVYDPGGTLRGSMDVPVAGGGLVQIPMRAVTGGPVTDPLVVAEPLPGSSGRVIVYASMVDNVTGDATYIESSF